MLSHSFPIMASDVKCFLQSSKVHTFDNFALPLLLMLSFILSLFPDHAPALLSSLPSLDLCQHFFFSCFFGVVPQNYRRFCHLFSQLAVQSDWEVTMAAVGHVIGWDKCCCLLSKTGLGNQTCSHSTAEGPKTIVVVKRPDWHCDGDRNMPCRWQKLFQHQASSLVTAVMLRLQEFSKYDPGNAPGVFKNLQVLIQ